MLFRSEREASAGNIPAVPARHITLRFAPGEQALLDQRLDLQGIGRKLAVTVATLATVAAFLRGTDLVATLPSLLCRGTMQEFAHCPAPVDTGQFAINLLWHRRMHRDPAHQWFRQLVRTAATAITARANT